MTDLTLQEAVAEVGKFGRIIKGLEKLTETAQALQGAEQLIAERQAQADALLPVIEQRNAELTLATSAVAEARATAKQMIDAAKEKAAAIVAEADAQSKEFVAAAHQTVADLQAETKAASDALAALKAQQIEAQATLDGIVERIAAANEARRKMLAGEA